MGTSPLSGQVAVRRPWRQKLLGMVCAECIEPTALQSRRQLYLLACPLCIPDDRSHNLHRSQGFTHCPTCHFATQLQLRSSKMDIWKTPISETWGYR